MADLELVPQKTIGFDSSYNSILYEKEDGPNVSYIFSNEIRRYSLSFEYLSVENYNLIYDLWSNKKLFTSFTWYNSIDQNTYDVKFYSKPSFNISRGVYSVELELLLNIQQTYPECIILLPTTNLKYDNYGVETIDISGTASDDVSVVSVTWSNDKGGSGVATGTTSWSISDLQLYSGENVITVVATDSGGKTGKDKITVIYSPIALWILLDGSWNDSGFWIDTELWNDGE